MRLRLVPFALVFALVAHPALAGDDYDFPIQNRFVATVIGTPPEHRAPLPRRVPTREHALERFPERSISTVFWNERSLRYSVALQDGPAPLIFLIAGTGARFDSEKMVFLQKVFYGAGMSVVNLSSPTQTEFIVSGSEHMVPGYTRADVQDLYNVMREIYARLEGRVDVTEFYLSGYSLGATQSAFLGERDQREGAFGFRKILLLCPSKSLFTSVGLLDEMVREAIPGGGPDLVRQVHELFRQVAEYLYEQGRSDLDVELLFHAAAAEEFSDAQLKTLIGVAFRISLANILFSSDVMTDSGRVVPAGTNLHVRTSLTPFMKMSARWSFEEYLDEVLVPYWSDLDPRIDREAIIRAGDLASIEGYLRDFSAVRVLTSADELILAPEDLEFLRETFGERATIYPSGGHCGNLMYRHTVADMLQFLAPAGGAP